MDQTTGLPAATWDDVLAHRPDPGSVALARARFERHGVSAALVAATLADDGAALFRDVTSGRDDWSAAYGGLLGAALLAGEITAYGSSVVARAAAARSAAVDALLEDVSAVSVADALGISRQKVYEIARGGATFRASISRPTPENQR